MDSKSLKLLRIYNSRASLTIEQLSAVVNESPFDILEYVARLCEKKLLRVELDYAERHGIATYSQITIDTPLQITVDGKEAIEDTDKMIKLRRNEMIRYVITTGIAIAAFIKSFFF